MYAGIVLAGFIGGSLGAAAAATMLGDSSQFSYLSRNKGAIVRAELPFDKAPEGFKI
jgi:hypothetical protein